MVWAQLCDHVMTALLMRPLLMTASCQLHKGVSCSKGASDAEETCAEVCSDFSILKVDLVVIPRRSGAPVIFRICSSLFVACRS